MLEMIKNGAAMMMSLLRFVPASWENPERGEGQG